MADQWLREKNIAPFFYRGNSCPLYLLWQASFMQIILFLPNAKVGVVGADHEMQCFLPQQESVNFHHHLELLETWSFLIGHGLFYSNRVLLIYFTAFLSHPVLNGCWEANKTAVQYTKIIVEKRKHHGTPLQFRTEFVAILNLVFLSSLVSGEGLVT